MRMVRYQLNWRIVRGLGELQLLTKASYITLILVPILAATWPAVRLIVNNHNKAVFEATVIMKKAVTDFGVILEKISDEELIETMEMKTNVHERTLSNYSIKERWIKKTDQFLISIDDYLTDFSKRTIETPRFPWTFAAAFFAALFVIVGHLVYQLFSPDQIKKWTLEEFVVSRKSDFVNHPSNDGLLKAKHFDQSALGRFVSEDEGLQDQRRIEKLIRMPKEDQRMYLDRLPISDQVSLKLCIDLGPTGVRDDALKHTRSIVENNLGNEQMRNGINTAHITVIERGAKVEYLSIALQSKYGAIAAALLYAFALALVISIIKVQTSSVAEAASILTLKDLFFP